MKLKHTAAAFNFTSIHLQSLFKSAILPTNFTVANNSIEMHLFART